MKAVFKNSFTAEDTEKGTEAVFSVKTSVISVSSVVKKLLRHSEKRRAPE
jgi:hypothetical protein